MSWLGRLKEKFLAQDERRIVLSDKAFKTAERIRRITAKVSVSDAVDEALIRFETILKAQFQEKSIIVTNRKTRSGEMEFKSFIVDKRETEKCFSKERR